MDVADSTYQQICSVRTVQSERKGFFCEFHAEVKASCGEAWLTNYFGKLKSNEARVLSIFSDREICDPVLGVLENVQPVYKPKDGLLSAQRRAQAEKNSLLGNMTQALACANVAVIRAPAKDMEPDIDDGLTLAMALRSRAIILIAMGAGEAALNDLKLAGNFGLETRHSVDYYLILAKAYACMDETARAEISLKLAEQLSGGGNELTIACRQELPFIKQAKKNKPLQAPPLVHGEHADLHGASSLVKLVESKEKGRFVVSNSALNTGDVVLCESPVAACLLPHCYGSHCHHCFEKLITPVPCLKCSGVAFCSTQCMGEACETYHRFECEFMDLLIGSGMSILCYIALRIFTQAPNLESGLNTATLLYSNLCKHDEARRADDYLQRALMAGFLLRCLQKAQYFGRRKTEGVNPTAIELKVGSALLGLLHILQYNAHEINGTLVTEEHRFDGSRIINIGAGLYGTGAYFNHECWPTVGRYFVGKKLVLITTKPHQANEIIAENYGPIFTKMNLKERQRTLRGRYLFDCHCVACHENWPTIQKLDKQVRFRCPSSNCTNLLKFPKDLAKDVRCPQCRKNVSLKEHYAKLVKIEELYREAAEAMHKEKTQQAIELFKDGIDRFFQIGAQPHKDTLLAQLAFIKCCADTGTIFHK